MRRGENVLRLRVKAGSPDTEALRREIQDVRFALDVAAIVAMTDRRGVITYVNDQFCEISGYSRQELLGKTHRVIKSGLHGPEFYRDLWRTISSGRIWRGEICNRAKDGHLYWVLSVIVPFLGPDGRPERYVAIRTDITNRKRLELERESLLGQLESAARAREELVATVSHDLGNFLGSMQLGLDLLERHRDVEPDARAQGALRSMRRGLESMRTLIEDLRGISRLEAGQAQLELSTVDLAALIREQLELFRPRAESKGLHLAGELPGEPVQTLGDRRRLHQVLSNLIGNALKFTTEGEVRVSLRQDPLKITVEVQDSGPGIAPEDQRNVFERYWKTSRSDGSGLGLHISRKIIELHGGTIGLRSAPGKGSTFHFTLPRR